MSNKRETIATGEIYHVFNKTLFYEDIFSKKRIIDIGLKTLDYYRYPQTIRYSRFKALKAEDRNLYENNFRGLNQLVDIYAFTLMPNHYHLLLKQNSDGGIKTFISNVQNSIAKFYNLKYERSGPVFVTPFKSKRIENDELFLHVSRYIHLNPVTSYLIEPENLTNCNWNSFSIYMNNNKNSMIDQKLLISLIGTREKYRKFVIDQVNYQRKLQMIKRFIFE